MKYDWNEERIREAIKISDSYTETLRNLNIPTQGNNSATLKRKIKEYNIDISHFTFRKQYKEGTDNNKYVEAYEYLNSDKHISSSKLKNKLIKEGYKENKCELCGITEWLGKPIICQLHHINGDHSDNRLENLQILCPNCHSQTENYCGNSAEKTHYYCKDCGTEITKKAIYCIKCSAKHHSKVQDRPTGDDLLNLFLEYKSFSAIGKLYEVTDKAVSKWFIKDGFPGKVSELKEYINNL